MEKKEKPTDFMYQIGEFQKQFFDQWAEYSAKFYQPWMDAAKYAHPLSSSFVSPDLFSMWTAMIRETIGKAAGKSQEGLGPDVLSRILRASNVFVALNEFWMEVLKEIPNLFQAKWDDATSREIFEGWVKRYKKVFEQLVGSPISDTADEMMTTWLNAVQMRQSALGLMWSPWLQAMPQWLQQAEQISKGDWGAFYQARSLWREVYDETLGRVFRMPAFGLTKEQIEKLRRTYDAFIKYGSALPQFYQYFFNTGMESLKNVFEKVKTMAHDEATPDVMREVYKIWWTTNEDAFFELFKKEEFGNAMAEVLNYWLRLKRLLDELSGELCKTLSIPTYEEFDDLSRALHDLRRKVRMQQKVIEELQQKLKKRAR